MMNFVYTLCSSTPGQIQYGGFRRARLGKSGDMIRDRVRILYLLFLWQSGKTVWVKTLLENAQQLYGRLLNVLSGAMDNGNPCI